MESVTDKAWAKFEQGAIEEAGKLYAELLENDHKPEDLEMIKLQYGYVLVAMQQYEVAEALYKDLYNQTGNHVYLHQMGYVAKEAGDLMKAKQLFEKESELIPGEGSVAQSACFYELAFISLVTGEMEDALKYAEHCLNEAEASKDTITLAVAHRLTGDIQTRFDRATAIDHYKKSIARFEEAGDLKGASSVAEVLQLVQSAS